MGYVVSKGEYIFEVQLFVHSSLFLQVILIFYFIHTFTYSSGRLWAGAATAGESFLSTSTVQ